MRYLIPWQPAADPRESANHSLKTAAIANSQGQLVDSSEGMWELLNQAFGDVFTKEDLSDIPDSDVTIIEIEIAFFKENRMESILQLLQQV